MKKVKRIKIDADLCNGCRACEMACSAFHAEPKYSSMNPEKSHIRVLFDVRRNLYIPVLAGPFTDAECAGRDMYVIDGKEYDECAFCRAACPSRELFHDPDSGLPLKCDMCEDEPPLEEPLCVQWCITDALTYEEWEEEEEEEETINDIEVGLEALANKHGLQKVTDTLARLAMAKKGEYVEAKE
ncbi:MAG: (4Fe-4S)-binding protein [Dehalococcoidia bacterium]